MIYFQMSKGSKNFKTKALWAKEHVYGVSNFWDHSGQVWTKLVQCLVYNYLYTISYTIRQSVCFLTYLLKFYSGGAVDLWSCFNIPSFWNFREG